MNKWMSVVTAAVVVVTLGVGSLVARETRNKTARPAHPIHETNLSESADEARASLKSVSKSSLTDLFAPGSSSGELSIPVTLKIARAGNGWKVSGIELVSEELPSVKPAPPVVRGASLTSGNVGKDASKLSVAPPLPANTSAFAIYFLANGSAIGTKGNETVAVISQQAKTSRVKHVVVRGYSERDLVDSMGKSVAGQRADAVKVALEKAGVESSKIQIEKGGKSPDGLTPKQKRRVEVVLQ